MKGLTFRSKKADDRVVNYCPRSVMLRLMVAIKVTEVVTPQTQILRNGRINMRESTVWIMQFLLLVFKSLISFVN